jgi:hypothetical protein
MVTVRPVARHHGVDIMSGTGGVVSAVHTEVCAARAAM